MAAGLLFFSEPVTRLLFEDGRFTAADTRAVSWLLVVYLGVVVGTGLGDLLSRVLYALHDTRTPVVVGLAGFGDRRGAQALADAATGRRGSGRGDLGLLPAQSRGAGGDFARPAGAGYAVGNARVLAAQRQWRGGGVHAGLCRRSRCATPFAVLPAAAVGALIYFASLWLLGDEFARKLTAVCARIDMKSSSAGHASRARASRRAKDDLRLAAGRPGLRLVVAGDRLACCCVVDGLVLGSLERAGWTAGELWRRHNKLVEENHRRATTTNEGELRQWLGEPLPAAAELRRAATTILVLGDSFVWGPPYQTLNHLWWRQLAIELERRGYHDVQVRGAGPSRLVHAPRSWSVRQKLIPEIKPDLVIWGYVTNDAGREARAADRRFAGPRPVSVFACGCNCEGCCRI